jgi:SAM-dependent methyltransferase
MSTVKDQYEAYPYPERDPADEAKRLISGSPSHPLEIDHFLFGGRRDWAQGTRILVAGGGTGDALIQLAQVLTHAGRPYEITYIDLSTASRKIAEARARVRGLTGITFITGSLLDAADHGPFDYIDCCGVLHHLPDPQAGFDALAAALAPDGGLGCMVYAPYGRTGVYPLQDAFKSLFKGLHPEAQLEAAKAVYASLPDAHPFKRNPHLVDHEASDAGFFDLLLHSQDRPFTIDALHACLSNAGLEMTGVPQPVLYDLSRFVAPPEGLSPVERMALAEKLDGTIKLHICYAQKAGGPGGLAGGEPDAIPHLKGVAGPALAQKLGRDGQVTVTLNGTKHQVVLPKAAAKPLSLINGKRDLNAIRSASGLDPLAWQAIWRPTERALSDYGLLLYSYLTR